MAEILTESFCERCGTRYTFEATGRRRWGVGRIRTFTRGVKNFVANDDASFAEALAAAREDDARSASMQQLDAFHGTFNFCMSCRQYTCRNCWNGAAGECLSCAPDLSMEALPAAFPDLAVLRPQASVATFPEPGRADATASAWPTADLRPTHELRAIAAPRATDADLSSVEAPAIAARSAGAEIELTPEELTSIQGALADHGSWPDGGPSAAPAESGQPAGFELKEAIAAVEAPANATAPVETTPIAAEPPNPPEPIAGARAETRRLLRRFRPRPDRATRVATPTASADRAVPAPVEAAPAGDGAAAPIARVPAVTVTAVDARSVAPEIAAVAEPATPGIEPAAPEPPGAPERTAAEPPLEPSPASAPAAPPTDHVVQPTWRMVAPESGSPAEPAPTPATWTPTSPVTRRAADAMPVAPWAARVATARPLESPVWAASSRDILAAEAAGAGGPVAIQSCVGCGLSLSANARFCRRCGTRQG